jgi:phage shock protein C
MVAKNKRLYRSESEKMVAGVCGGVAEYLDIDPTIVRLVWVLFTALSGIIPGVIIYILAAIIVPLGNKNANAPAAEKKEPRKKSAKRPK